MRAEVHAKTGRIVRKYTDACLAGVPVRVELVKYALDLRQDRRLQHLRHGDGRVRPRLPIASPKPGASLIQWPPRPARSQAGLTGLFRSNLGSPIGLGILGHPEKHDTAQRLMKALVTYLRHGMVYYHYFLEEIPLEGDGQRRVRPRSTTCCRSRPWNWARGSSSARSAR